MYACIVYMFMVCGVCVICMCMVYVVCGVCVLCVYSVVICVFLCVLGQGIYVRSENSFGCWLLLSTLLELAAHKDVQRVSFLYLPSP